MNTKYAKHTCGVVCARTHVRKKRSIHYCIKCDCYWTNGEHLPAGRKNYPDPVKWYFDTLSGTLEKKRRLIYAKYHIRVPLTTLSDWTRRKKL